MLLDGMKKVRNYHFILSLLINDYNYYEAINRKLAIELSNGRAAQMGILALMVHEKIGDHNPYVINTLLGYPVPFNAGL